MSNGSRSPSSHRVREALAPGPDRRARRRSHGVVGEEDMVVEAAVRGRVEAEAGEAGGASGVLAAGALAWSASGNRHVRG